MKPRAQQGPSPTRALLADGSSCGAALAAAAGDMDQVTPALPQPPRLTQGVTAIPEPSCAAAGGQTDLSTELGCSQRRIGTLKANCSPWQGGSRVWPEGMEQFGGTLKAAWLGRGAAYTHRAGGKATCGGDSKESFQHFGNWKGQGCCRGTSSSHLGMAGAELSFVILV